MEFNTDRGSITAAAVWYSTQWQDERSRSLYARLQRPNTNLSVQKRQKGMS